MKENIIVTKSFEFALKIVQFSELLEERKHFIFANQILKSGTSVGANVREAQHAESKTDFIHKLKIAAKEAEETEYWLLLCSHSKNYPDTDNLLCLIKDLQRILTRIIVTTKKNN
jgi:four helix bundle protein